MTPSPPLSTPERPLSATRLAQYVTVRGRCERYLRLALFPSEGQAQMHRYGVTPEALSPLLAEAGSVFEDAAVAQQQCPITQAVNGGEIMRNEDHGAAVFSQFCNPLEAFRLKSRVADGENFVQQEDIGIEVGGNGKTQADKHAR